MAKPSLDLSRKLFLKINERENRHDVWIHNRMAKSFVEYNKVSFNKMATTPNVPTLLASPTHVVVLNLLVRV